MRSDHTRRGLQELRQVRQQDHALFWVVGLFSLFANLLMLTGPLYMLQVYDRVLSSESTETLIALSLLVLFLYGVMAALDFVRGRIMAQVGLRVWRALQHRVFVAVMRKAAVLPDERTTSGFSDLDMLRRVIAAPVASAGFDLPWTPVFFAVIFIFHPLLGGLALLGAGVLVALTIANQMLSFRNQAAAGYHGQAATNLAEQLRSEAESVRAMGMTGAAFARWQQANDLVLSADMAAADTGAGFSVFGKVLRLLLQSAMLGLGAWLVMSDQMTPGGMIAGSVLLGRALAPVEVLLNQWPMAQQARLSWTNLAALLGEVPAETPRIALPKPAARLAVQGMTVVPPGDRIAALRSVSFTVEPGQAVGVIGPSGTGKSTLARALVGVWPTAGGHIRLDNATLNQYEPDALGRHIGYLPQRVELFDGTVAQNISRLSPAPDDDAVVRAARMAGAHEMILGLPQGYDTRIIAGQLRLSGGQLQRIGLARALYGEPVIVVLDEPNSNLDNAGSAALNHAIRQMKEMGRSVLIMAHRPAAIHECDMLLVLDGGMRVAFGPKEEVLKGMVKNAKSIQTVSPAAAGMR
ncbi:type I secretion system permease/ATPase [Sulfitobacter noctilucae]|uniref:type I secretion system permease/ATPase n=1 Tax=Sulfitobacter noctilucae TaxID=1342302 RepID=UPI00046AF887|nr:type I secretion system permease/ATPase [Sulfitobacter noctilucae]